MNGKKTSQKDDEIMKRAKGVLKKQEEGKLNNNGQVEQQLGSCTRKLKQHEHIIRLRPCNSFVVQAPICVLLKVTRKKSPKKATSKAMVGTKVKEAMAELDDELGEVHAA